MKQISYQVSGDTQRMIDELAEWWGLPANRHNTPVIAKCIERAHANERARRELAEFDAAIKAEESLL
jgi:hypothetical protein